MESMDYSVAGTGSIAYPGDIKAVGTVVGGKIHKIWGTENNKKKSCDEKP
jgi:PDZ domain-containing secreted protein